MTLPFAIVPAILKNPEYVGPQVERTLLYYKNVLEPYLFPVNVALSLYKPEDPIQFLMLFFSKGHAPSAIDDAIAAMNLVSPQEFCEEDAALYMLGGVGYTLQLLIDAVLRLDALPPKELVPFAAAKILEIVKELTQFAMNDEDYQIPDEIMQSLNHIVGELLENPPQLESNQKLCPADKTDCSMPSIKRNKLPNSSNFMTSAIEDPLDCADTAGATGPFGIGFAREQQVRVDEADFEAYIRSAKISTAKN